MKKRLDMLVMERFALESREKARGMIMAGHVYVEGQKEDKAGSLFSPEALLELRGERPPYVSRGGKKLEKALSEFGLSPEGQICMDVGASMGGFTDCLLQNKALFVYAVDVGHGQLDWKLRQDERVMCLEKTNIRYLTGDRLGEKGLPSFVTIDVSFISLEKVFPPVWSLLSDGGTVVALIKPQFEAGRFQVGKKGVVRDPSVHGQVIKRVLIAAAKTGFLVKNLTYSPIKGPEGNIEYLIHLKKAGPLPGRKDRDPEGWYRVESESEEEAILLLPAGEERVAKLVKEAGESLDGGKGE